MFSLPCLFLVTTCFAVLARSLPGPLDSLNLSNNADEAISDEGLEIAATPDWCSTDDGSAAQKRSDLPSGACRNPSADQKPKIRPLIDDSPRRKNNPNTDPGPEPSGPAHSIRPPGGKLGGCPEGWKLLCGRGLRSDDPHTNGLLVKNLYLLNPGIPCQAIWCCRHYWSDTRQGKTCDRTGAYILKTDSSSGYEVSEAGENEAYHNSEDDTDYDPNYDPSGFGILDPVS